MEKDTDEGGAVAHSINVYWPTPFGRFGLGAAAAAPPPAPAAPSTGAREAPEPAAFFFKYETYLSERPEQRYLKES